MAKSETFPSTISRARSLLFPEISFARILSFHHIVIASIDDSFNISMMKGESIRGLFIVLLKLLVQRLFVTVIEDV